MSKNKQQQPPQAKTSEQDNTANQDQQMNQATEATKAQDTAGTQAPQDQQTNQEDTQDNQGTQEATQTDQAQDTAGTKVVDQKETTEAPTPTEQQAPIPVPVSAPEPTQAPAVAQQPAPVQQPAQVVQPVPQPVRSLRQGQGLQLSVQTPKGKTVQELINESAKSGDLNQSAFLDTLSRIEHALSAKVVSTPEEASKHLSALYGTIVNALNNTKGSTEFNRLWHSLLVFFGEKKNEGFSGLRLYRGVPFWTKSREELLQLQAITNLIEVTNRLNGNNTEIRRQVRFDVFGKVGLNQVARSRLLAYYN